LPSGLQVKNHQTRELETNRHLALKSLKEKLDFLINGEGSKKSIKDEKLRKNKDRNRRRSIAKHQKEQPNSSADSNQTPDQSNR